MCAMRSLPLAPKPLTTLHCFDPSYRVPVYLDQPLWGEGQGGRGLLTTRMMALCLQLDAAIVTSSLHDQEGGGRGRRVTFEQRLPARVSSLLDKMAEQLADCDLDLESYLRESGLGLVFPRTELCLQEPEQDLVKQTSPLMDDYMTKLSQLHMVLALAQQLSSDVQLSSSHKYIAHQTALLYQCVGQTTVFPDIKKDIEQHFNAVKAGCSSETGQLPRLPSQLQTWVVGMCQQLQERAMSVPSQTLSSCHHVTSLLQ